MGFVSLNRRGTCAVSPDLRGTDSVSPDPSEGDSASADLEGAGLASGGNASPRGGAHCPYPQWVWERKARGQTSDTRWEEACLDTTYGLDRPCLGAHVAHDVEQDNTVLPNPDTTSVRDVS
jgi:hypothetical protein